MANSYAYEQGSMAPPKSADEKDEKVTLCFVLLCFVLSDGTTYKVRTGGSIKEKLTKSSNFWEGLFSFTGHFKEERIQNITFRNKDDPNYILFEDTITKDHIKRYLQNAEGNSDHKINNLTLWSLILGIKFQDSDLLSLPINWEDQTIKSNLNALFNAFEGIQDQYIEMLVERRSGRRRLTGKTLLSFILKDPVGAELWNTQKDYREKILIRIKYPDKGFQARLKANSDENLSLLEKDTLNDLDEEYNEAFKEEIKKEHYLPLRNYMAVHEMLPSKHRSRISTKWSFLGHRYFHQLDFERNDIALALEDQAFRISKSLVDSKKAKAAASKRVNNWIDIKLSNIKALC